VFQNLYLLERSTDDEVLVLSGDHIYRMDYAAMIRFHRQHEAPFTIACMEVPTEEAGGFGVVTVDGQERITAFTEKPEDAEALETSAGHCLASMGIYVFDKADLIARLQADHMRADSTHDFGHDILPALLSDADVYAYRFGARAGRVSPDRYWRDVGTLDAYYDASMALLEPVPPLDLYQQDWVIRTYQGQNPPARTVPGESGHEGVFVNSILAGGVVICGGGVDHSILFPRVRVDDEALVQESILFDGVHVGAGAELRNCIVEKQVAIPPQERIGLDPARDRERFIISSKGIVVVPKGYRF
jgi:glucose-1-phosphate adenylyltransferase